VSAFWWRSQRSASTRGSLSQPATLKL